MTARAEVVPGRDMAIAAARAANEKQANDVIILEVAPIIAITDYFVICSASSQRHIKTVVEEIERALGALGEKPTRREGEGEGGWWLLDYIDVVVHVFGEEQRAYYELERLWLDAARVPWEAAGRASSG